MNIITSESRTRTLCDGARAYSFTWNVDGKQHIYIVYCRKLN